MNGVLSKFIAIRLSIKLAQLIQLSCFRKVCGFSNQSINDDIALFRASFRLLLMGIISEMSYLIKNQMQKQQCIRNEPCKKSLQLA